MARRARTVTAEAAGVLGAPAELLDWFAGRSAQPITAYIEPFWHALPALWTDFARRFPGAPMPPGAAVDPLLRVHLGAVVMPAAAKMVRTRRAGKSAD